MKFGQVFASLTGREVTDQDGLGDIEAAVEQALQKKMGLVRSKSRVVASRGNIFKYTSGSLNGLDRRIDSMLSDK